MAAVALAAQASGAVKSRITVLLLPEEIDRAAKKAGEFPAADGIVASGDSRYSSGACFR